MKRLFLYLLLSALPLVVVAQGVVEGVVTDAKSGQPMEFVNVGVLGNASGAVTTPMPRVSTGWSSKVATA